MRSRAVGISAEWAEAIAVVSRAVIAAVSQVAIVAGSEVTAAVTAVTMAGTAAVTVVITAAGIMVVIGVVITAGVGVIRFGDSVSDSLPGPIITVTARMTIPIPIRITRILITTHMRTRIRRLHITGTAISASPVSATAS